MVHAQTIRIFLGMLACSGLVTGSLSPVAAAQGTASTKLNAAFITLQDDSRQVSSAASKQEKAKAWLRLNHDAVRFAGEMNRAFPHSQYSGETIDPPEAQDFANRATHFGVRIFFCEPGAEWAASNEGFFKYLELWPSGPDAEEAAWMGPAGNQAGCGDFEGTPDELEDIIRKNQDFLDHFPNSRFASEATKRLTQARKMLHDTNKSGQK